MRIIPNRLDRIRYTSQKSSTGVLKPAQMVMFASYITDWCVIDMAFHLYRDDAEEPMSQECARDEWRQVNRRRR